MRLSGENILGLVLPLPSMPEGRVTIHQHRGNAEAISWDMIRQEGHAVISPPVSSPVVIIRIMTVVRTGAGRVAYLQIGVRVVDDVPEPVLVLLDPDDAAAVGAGRDQEDPDIVGFLGCAGKDQRVIFGRHAVAVFGTRSRGETPEDVVAGGVDFISGSRLLLDMKPYLDKFRFRSLSDPQVWNSAVTNGIFVRFGDVELSHDEILSMAEQEH